MRELKEDELLKVMNKLNKYVGNKAEDYLNKNKLFLHEQKVYLSSPEIFKKVQSLPRKMLILAGTCLGKFTKTMNFRITVTALPFLAKFAVNKVWIKNSAEMNFLYGNDVLKSHIFRMPEDISQNCNVILFNQSDVPLGFGVSTKSSASFATSDHNSLAIIRQSDTGEYLRNESHIV